MLRETGFIVGGGLLTGSGVLFLALLLVLGAGWWEYPSYLEAFLMIGFGAFFIQVGRSEGADRRRTLQELEAGSSPASPPSGPN